ncbi:hypothetical protein CFP56_006135 [Quercus suber]
MSVWTAT